VYSALIVATVLVYTWIVAPVAPRWTAALASAIVLGIAVVRAGRRGEWGLAQSAFLPALGAAAIFTTGAGAAIALVGWRLGSWHARPARAADAALLLLWALGQQFALQIVLLRDAQSVVSSPAAIVVAAAAFAALHLPNPFLTGATFAAALAWCAIYDRHPNLLPLALSHALLTLVVLVALSDAATGRLRVGAAYLDLH